MKAMNALVAGTSALKPEPAHMSLTVVRGGGNVPRRVERPVSSLRSKISCILVVVALLIASVFAVVTVFSSREAASAAAAASVSWVEARVQPGDSLWAIAQERPVEGLSTPELVDLIKTENGMGQGMLSAGELLLVPAV